MAPSLVWIMAVTCGVVVANIYYNQPLLQSIASSLSLSEKAVGWIATITQVGYTLGLLFMVPLGDKFERKRLILLMLTGATVFLLIAGFTLSYPILLIASLFIGIFSSVPQLLLPMAAHLAPDESRGKVVGKVMSGLLIGILLSRTVSGYVGAHFGWQTMFLAGGGLMLVIMALLYTRLPDSQPTYTGTYGSLMKSLWTLVRTLPPLRQAAATSLFQFGAFSAFWTTLVFFLEGPDYQFKSDIVGLFGLIGAVGALAAPLAGRSADKRGPRPTILAGMVVGIVAFALMGILSKSLLVVILGVILLDMGQQLTHISNQTKVFALKPEARSRLNTVYMSSAFAGGSLGSFLGMMAWTSGQWPAVCLLGIILISIGLFLNRKAN
ncbi:MAG: MFS transporter [Siphonobacter aquaeclarae]|nr:MFS transporter [Siphonobacter aquaeclarae]